MTTPARHRPDTTKAEQLEERLSSFRNLLVAGPKGPAYRSPVNRCRSYVGLFEGVHEIAGRS